MKETQTNGTRKNYQILSAFDKCVEKLHYVNNYYNEKTCVKKNSNESRNWKSAI